MREEGEGEAEQGGNVVGAAAAAPELPSITRRTGTGTAYGWREGGRERSIGRGSHHSVEQSVYNKNESKK